MRSESQGRALLAAVERWQADEMKHPLTCPDHSDVPLQGHLSAATWNVYLFCPVEKCQHCQAWVPDCVLEDYENAVENVSDEDG